MRALKLLLTAANLLLAAALLLFAGLVLFVRVSPDLGLPELSWEDEAPRPPVDDRVLAAVRNPIRPGPGSLPPGLQVALLGTLPSERLSAAFFRSGKDEFVAFVGEGVGSWRLEEVGRDRAVFTQGRDRREVRLDESAPPRAPSVKPPR